MSVPNLEGRYRRLLRFYPRRYRAARGDEIVDTYMELAAPDRTTPSLADTADIVKAGMRQRLRDSPNGFDEGLRIAAIVAMCAVAAIGATGIIGWRIAETVEGTNTWINPALVDASSWLAALWLIVGIGAPLLPTKLARAALSVAMAASLLAAFLPLFVPALTPELTRLGALIICGALALAWPSDTHWWTRALPLLAAATLIGAQVGTKFLPWYLDIYVDINNLYLGFFLMAGVALIIRALVRRHAGMWWAVALLAAPISFVAWRPVVDVLHLNQLVTGTLPLLTLSIGVLILGIAVPTASYAIANRKQRHF